MGQKASASVLAFLLKQILLIDDKLNPLSLVQYAAH